MQTSAGVTTSVQTINGQKVLIDSKTGQTIKVLGSSTAASAPNDAVNTIAGTMQTLVGKDGKISPTDWANALNEWTSAGYTQASFISNFQSYANTADPTQHYIGLK
jgi:hypothetical protein